MQTKLQKLHMLVGFDRSYAHDDTYQVIIEQELVEFPSSIQCIKILISLRFPQTSKEKKKRKKNA